MELFENDVKAIARYRHYTTYEKGDGRFTVALLLSFPIVAILHSVFDVGWYVAIGIFAALLIWESIRRRHRGREYKALERSLLNEWKDSR